MTSSSRASRRIRRAGTILIPPALGTLAVVPSVGTAAPAAAAPVFAAASASVPAIATVPDAASIGVALQQPIVGAARSGGGFVLAAADGGVFALSGAAFRGSMGGHRLNRPIVGVATTPSGNGYWLVAADGGVFSFGDAAFYGSMGNRRLNSPIVGIAATPSGRGYWLVASDGGVFTFGDAPFLGSTGGMRLVSPVVGIAADPATGGYWLAASDGGVFTFGTPFLGSAARRTSAPVTSIAAAPDGSGYWLAGADGSVFSFGAPFQGAPVNAGQGPVVAMTAVGNSYRLTTSNGTVLGPTDGGVLRAASAPSVSGVAAGVVAGINNDRASRGVGPVAADAQLIGLAQDWSRQMAARNVLGHRNLGALLSDPAWAGYNTFGETIWTGDAASDPGAVVTGWVNSPVHQAVLVDGRFNAVGIGVYVSGGRMWVTADFGGR